MEQRLSETKPQRWRALAVYDDGKEALLILGNNYSQVQETYDDPFFEHFMDDERNKTKEIQLQKWVGLPDRGKWVTQRNLPIPESLSLKIGARKID